MPDGGFVAHLAPSGDPFSNGWNAAMKLQASQPKPGSFRWKELHGEITRSNGTPSEFNCEKWCYLLDAPFKVSSRCCTVMKKRPMKKYSKETGRVPIIATMANESRSRRATWLRMGCNAFSGKKPSSQPMSFWTEEDVLEYLYTYQVPYASVYGEIVRTDGGGGRRQAKSVLAVSFAPLALTLKKLQTVSSV